MSKRLLRSTLTVGGMTLVSRIFGLLRDVALATVFGASGGTDAFLVAFKIPNFMRRLFGEGAFSQAFVPVFAEYREKGSREELQDLLDNITGKLGGILLLITIVGCIAAPGLVYIFAPGFTTDAVRFQLTVELLRVTFPYLFFIALVAFSAGILNSCGQFGVPAFTPVLLNLCLIAAAYWFAQFFEQPLMALAWGVFIAGVVQLLFQFPSLLKLGLLPRPRITRSHAGVSKVLRLMMPAVIGSSAMQINLLLDTVIASFLTVGSVTWLYYSDRLLEFPLGVLGIAVATVILPALSDQHARESSSEFNDTLNWAVRLVLVIAMPACIGLFMLAAPVLSTLFGYGEFDAPDVHLASLSLMAFILGLPAFILVKVLGPGYYARQDTKTPVRIAMIAMVSNMALNICFVVPLVLSWYQAPHIALALATTFSAYLNAFLLYRGLRKNSIFIPNPGWGRLFTQIALASGVMALLLWQITPGISVWSHWHAIERLIRLGLIIALAVSIYFATLWITGMRPTVLRRQ